MTDSPNREQIARELAKELGWRFMPSGSTKIFTNAVGAKLFDSEYRDALISREVSLRKFRQHLKTSRIRLQICLGRMTACNEEPQKHEVSLVEIPAWIEEMDEWLAGDSTHGR